MGAAPMNEPTDESGKQHARTSLAASVFAGAGIGLMVGLMLGLAAPAGDGKSTVAIFIGAVGAALAVLLGLNDRHFSTAKALRIGAFGLSAVIGAAGGLNAKHHNVFKPTLEEQKKEFMDAGFSECQALDLLAGRPSEARAPVDESTLSERKDRYESLGLSKCEVLGLLTGGAPAAAPSGGEADATTAKTRQMTAIESYVAGTGLMTSSIEKKACNTLNLLREPDEVPFGAVRRSFAGASDTWKTWSDSVRAADLSDDEKRDLLIIARDAVCLPEKKLSADDCTRLEADASQSESGAKLHAAYSEIETLIPVRDQVMSKVGSPAGQTQALTLLSKRLCQSSG